METIRAVGAVRDPEVASDHQSYFPRPNDGVGPCFVPSASIFSLSDIRPTASLARLSIGERCVAERHAAEGFCEAWVRELAGVGAGCRQEEWQHCFPHRWL